MSAPSNQQKVSAARVPDAAVRAAADGIEVTGAGGAVDVARAALQAVTRAGYAIVRADHLDVLTAWVDTHGGDDVRSRLGFLSRLRKLR